MARRKWLATCAADLRAVCEAWDDMHGGLFPGNITKVREAHKRTRAPSQYVIFVGQFIRNNNGVYDNQKEAMFAAARAWRKLKTQLEM